MPLVEKVIFLYITSIPIVTQYSQVWVYCATMVILLVCKKFTFQIMRAISLFSDELGKKILFPDFTPNYSQYSNEKPITGVGTQ